MFALIWLPASVATAESSSLVCAILISHTLQSLSSFTHLGLDPTGWG